MKDHVTVPNLTGGEETFRPSAYLKIFPMAAAPPAAAFHRILLAVNGEFSVYIDTPLSGEEIVALMEGRARVHRRRPSTPLPSGV